MENGISMLELPIPTGHIGYHGAENAHHQVGGEIEETC